jgi:hypothetical protein
MEPDDTPTLDDAAIDTMLRLKDALNNGTYDGVRRALSARERRWSHRLTANRRGVNAV